MGHRRDFPMLRRRLARLLLPAVISLAALSCVGYPADAQTAEARAEEALRTGRYDEAIAGFRAAAGAANASPAAVRGLVDALMMVGRYEEAEETARRAAESPTGAELANTLGEVLVARGKLAEAESAFVRAVSAPATDSLTARLNLAILRFDRGEREAAMREFDRFIDVYNRGTRLTAEELVAIATACRYLGLERHEMFQDALKAYDRAIAADPEWLEPKVKVGELFLEKYNAPDARASFEEVLAVNERHPAALVGMAKLLLFDGAPNAAEPARRALEVNEHYVPAHVVLASLAASNEDYEEATRAARAALDANPASIEALAVLGATRYMAGDRAGFEDAQRRALALNPRSAEFHGTLAELAARNRLYREAADFARQGVSLDSTAWHTMSVLGMNQLRLGEVAEARRNLERAFEGDPYDVWVKNTLDLLDTFTGYDEIRTDRFIIMAEKKESALMGLYVSELASEAFDSLQARYGYRPAGPIRIEMYRSHADFSVRTVGLTGLGALGVAFGDVLALDSPSARELGRFNWGSVLWHELAHTFTLGASANRVPRWFSEGLSVLEERRARPGWGDDVTPTFLIAYRDGLLPPVSELNEAFTRPDYPEQIGHAYYMASLVCEMIEEQAGIQAIRDMLRGYRDGRTTEEAFRTVLRTDLAGFDRRFDGWLRARYEKAMDALGPTSPRNLVGELANRRRAAGASGAPGVITVEPNGPFGRAMVEGQEHLEAGRHDQAIAALERAKALFPQYAGEGSAYALLARIHLERGDKQRAMAELTAMTNIDGANYAALRQLADLREEAGDHAGAAEALDKALWVNPYEIAMHERLAGLYARTNRHAKAVRERRAVLALDPVDLPEAHYQLALALWQAGERDDARRAVLRALELAPNFEKAQELLLTMRRGAAAPDASRRPPAPPAPLEAGEDR